MQPSFEFDHVMLCVPEPDAAIDALCKFGLTLDQRGPQRNTGAGHASFLFDNAYLEIAWPEPGMTAFPDAPGLHFAERADGRRSGWSPFGLSFRTPDGPASTIPFSTWPFAARFLPPGAVPIPIGANSDNPREPLIIVSLVSRRPDAKHPASRRHGRLGFGEVTHVRLRLPAKGAVSPELQAVKGFGWLSIETGGDHHLALEFDDAPMDKNRNFSPALPLSFSW